MADIPVKNVIVKNANGTQTIFIAKYGGLNKAGTELMVKQPFEWKIQEMNRNKIEFKAGKFSISGTRHAPEGIGPFAMTMKATAANLKGTDPFKFVKA
ncbi:MAG TPA: hypothetical protein VME43_09520 [Bryobacteraceae bacterium]|nr:hypothetical protein [Bryobacteraceae bacterium]